jgi:hypothetical protein
MNKYACEDCLNLHHGLMLMALLVRLHKRIPGRSQRDSPHLCKDIDGQAILDLAGANC